ncbi:hypothetical protein A4G27_07810 [Mycobacterium kansasii]|nr:hypothetical protein A4G27_07810 [Mycobacterium kansasii]
MFSNDAASGLLDEVDGLIEILPRGHRASHAVHLFAEIDGDDVRAFFGKSNRMRATLAPWRPRDECNLAVELHGVSSTLRRQQVGTGQPII